MNGYSACFRRGLVVRLSAGDLLAVDGAAHPLGAASGTDRSSRRAQGPHATDAARRRSRHLRRVLGHCLSVTVPRLATDPRCGSSCSSASSMIFARFAGNRVLWCNSRLPSSPCSSVCRCSPGTSERWRCVWIAGLINAFNMLDNMDALSGGVAWIAAGFLAVVPWLVGRPAVEEWGPYVILMGALSGFLWFNHPPARIFMGDAGSTFLGFMLGLGSVQAALRDGASVLVVASADL